MTTHPSTHHDLHWLPGSRVGWWAVALAGFTVGGVVLEFLAFAVGVVEPADSYTDSWVQLVWGACIWASAVAALVTGVVATLRRHERSWLVRAATVLGLLPVVLLLSEIALGKF
jgi:hypothetical protein